MKPSWHLDREKVAFCQSSEWAKFRRASMAIFGYARVSTVDQSLALQLAALRSSGCERIFEDLGVSGAKEKRRGLNAAFRKLKRGDTLIVWRLDRLGRSIRHLIEIIGRLQKRGVEFRSITENIDTTSAGGRMIFHVIAAMAEFERSLISERTSAGMAAARERGQQFGRKPSLTAAQCQEASRLLYHDGEKPAEVAHRYGVHPRTLKRLIANNTDILLEQRKDRARGVIRDA